MTFRNFSRIYYCPVCNEIEENSSWGGCHFHLEYIGSEIEEAEPILLATVTWESEFWGGKRLSDEEWHYDQN